MVNSDKYWFPIKVGNRKEFLIFSKLLKKGYKVYLPLIRYTIKKNERSIWKIKPIFKGIIFIYCKSEDLNQLKLIESGIKLFCNRKNPEYVKDLEFLMKERDNKSFISIQEYRTKVLGTSAPDMVFDDKFAVTLELSACQYFPFLIDMVKDALKNQMLVPGRIIRVRKMNYQ